ncbi:hypothetical protein RB598_003510 [Gaeumannomyces tritici]
MRSISTAAAALIGTATLAAANPAVVQERDFHKLPDQASGSLSKRDVLTPLPGRASELENKYQPYTDFDKDGCYYTAAVGADGKKNGGLNAGQGVPPNCLRAQCRDNNRLENNNLYSRSRCNNGWCAVMYEYYFEKDQIVCGIYGVAAHKHDWENVVVFVKDGNVKRVAPSCHGKYDKATNSPPLKDGRPKVVYHKDGGSTHCWRIANDKDDAIENYTGEWFLGQLVGWDNWPNVGLRNTAMEDFGGPRAKLRDEAFADNLKKAMDGSITGFDPNVDQ